MQNPIKTILGHLNKEEVVQKEHMTQSSICVIFNAVDHVSILAATLFAMLLRFLSTNKVTMVDIRDVIPETCDRYYWIDCGDFEAFVNYYTNGGVRMASLSKESKAWIHQLKDHSRFINGVRSFSPDSSESPAMTADILLEILGEYDYSDMATKLLGLSKYASINWLSNNISDMATAKFDTLLTLLHEHYNRCEHMDISLCTDMLMKISEAGNNTTNSNQVVKISEDSGRLNADETCLVRYSTWQKRAAGTIALKARDVNLGGKFFKYTTDMSSLVYSMLRRMSISGNKFIHVSHGAYGTIVYSNAPLDGVVDFVERGSFVLTK